MQIIGWKLLLLYVFMASADVKINLENNSDNSEDSDSSDNFSDSSEADEIIDLGELNMAYKYDIRDLELKYTGDPEDDLDSFITRFNNYAALRDYTETKSALAIITKIKGHAEVFLEQIPAEQKDTVSKIENLLRENFQGDSWRWSVETKLLSRTQLPNESLDDYASDIMRWCRQIEKSDSDQMSIFVRGLLPYLRGFVYSKQPKTFRTALDAARLGLAVQQTTHESDTHNLPSSSKPVHNTCTSVNQNESTLDTVVNLVSNLATRIDKLDEKMKGKKVSFANSNHNCGPPNRSGKRNMICYRCGRVGHVWRKCYAKFGVDGKPLN